MLALSCLTGSTMKGLSSSRRKTNKGPSFERRRDTGNQRKKLQQTFKKRRKRTILGTVQSLTG